MESATLRRVPQLSSAVQLGLIFGLLLLAAVAWAMTGDRMAGMDAGPGTDLGGLGFWVTAWVVMMAAMMFPSIAPMVVMYARIQEGKRERARRSQAGATALFVAGYLLTWAAAGLIGYAIFEVGRSLDLGFLAWDSGGPYVAGGGDRRGGDLPAHPAEGRLPAPLPQPDDVPAHGLAPGPHRRPADGHGARRLVRGLLLGADGGAVRARRDEHRLDGPDRGPDRDREAAALEGASRTAASPSCSSSSGSGWPSSPRTSRASPCPTHPRPRRRWTRWGMGGGSSGGGSMGGGSMNAPPSEGGSMGDEKMNAPSRGGMNDQKMNDSGSMPSGGR